jgi:hypothetical protein
VGVGEGEIRRGGELGIEMFEWCGSKATASR